MAGYTRQDTANNIANGNVIDANDLDAEFNQVESAFSSSTGHKHDGTSGEGPRIEKFGQAGELDGSTANVLKPKTDGTVDLGASDTEFKDAYFDGTVKTDVLTVDETSTLTGNVTASANVSVGGTLTVTGTTTLNGNIDLGDTSGDTVTVTGQVDSAIIPSADDTYDLGSTTKEWRNLYLDGTAEIDTLNAATVNIDGGAIDGTVIGANTSAAITGTTITGTSFVGDGSALTGIASGLYTPPGSREFNFVQDDGTIGTEYTFTTPSNDCYIRGGMQIHFKDSVGSFDKLGVSIKLKNAWISTTITNSVGSGPNVRTYGHGMFFINSGTTNNYPDVFINPYLKESTGTLTEVFNYPSISGISALDNDTIVIFFEGAVASDGEMRATISQGTNNPVEVIDFEYTTIEV